MKLLSIKGHEFLFLGLVPHTCLDGSSTVLYQWEKQCECVIDGKQCLESWSFKSPARNIDGDIEPPEDPRRHYVSQFLRLFCKYHRNMQIPGPKKPRKNKSTSYLSRQKVTDEEVAEMRKIAKAHVGTKIQLCKAMALVYPVSWVTIYEILHGRRRAPSLSVTKST